ncbi:hypothetical protein Q4567_18645 [Aliiglaciecola sp. 2_MG-2023]|uniref:hypothetical protein n=1 Tax=unclassified Aliiglaciecola TaxID=2593648 RepID=UPI0026E3929F|nr:MULTISPECIES: hypothetical protein [unclassified Aliiglaciecola]MDO6712760.1 hypothetical protein [Aliiglaciecola sp. 2_MG-2023]MDO6753841.1 hypothetical protein [Aliiglaciecola sp. 1_MG-2023]
MYESQSNISAILISWFPLLLVIIVVWLIPLFVIGKSNRVGKKEKLLWLFATFFVSWASFILYLIIAPILKDDE